MPDEGAVATIEAPAADSTLEIGTETTTETSSDSGSVDSDESDTPVAGETGHKYGAALYKDVKAKLRAAGLSSDELKNVRNAIWMADKANSASGGDLAVFEKIPQLMTRLADDPDAGQTPEQIVESTIAERSFWRDFDDKFQKADVSLLTQMITANPESFQKLAPAAMDEFCKMNPEGYSAYVAKATMGYLSGQQVPLQWAILETFLPNMPEFPGKDRLVAAIQKIYGAFEGLEGMAAKPLTPKKVEGGPEGQKSLNNSEDAVRSREMDLTRREWNGETYSTGTQLRDSEITRIATAQKVTLDDADKQKIKAAVQEEYNARCAANPNYGKAMRGYIEAGNKTEYKRRAESEYKKLIPGITARHTQAVIDQKKQAAVQPKAQGTPNQPTKVTQPSTAKGEQWIAGHPKTIGKQVDLNRTPHHWLANAKEPKAYIVGGGDTVYRWKPRAI